MPDFLYEALSRTGARSTGTITAGSEREAMLVLDGRGLMPLKIKPARAQAKRRWGRRVKGRHIAAFYSQLADLLHSGVPLLRALDVLERQSTNQTLAEALREVRAKVADGSGLAEAMSAHPHVFDELSASMVKAGQEGGFLEDVLKRIADFTEHQEDLKSKVVGALAYPVFLAFAGVAVLLVLVMFFVPRFEPIFAKLDAKGELPSLTKAILAFSHFLLDYGVLALGGLVAGVIALRRWVRTPSGRFRMDRLRLRTPAAGKIYLNFALSRFTRILGTLLHNGIPILNALRVAKDSTGNKVLARAIEESAENITAGDRLAKPLAACPYFPRDVVEMVSIAEESNTLDTVLVEIANGLEKRTGRQLELFVRLLEPVMLLVMAVVILIVVAGLLLPVFKMSTAMR
ncbi:MAG TPA: type II secretion system F family protein [Gemmataceae bacterium]